MGVFLATISQTLFKFVTFCCNWVHHFANPQTWNLIGFTSFYRISSKLTSLLIISIIFFLLFCNLQIVFFCASFLLQNIIICRGILNLASFYTLILQLESIFFPTLKKLLSELMIIIGPPSYETCELHLDWNFELPQVNFNAVMSFS